MDKPIRDTLTTIDLLMANPRGFCAGVERAIDTVRNALAAFGPPIYVRHEIVHNARVVAELEQQGAVFVEEVTEIPEGAAVIFSAHGVAHSVEEQARARNLRVIDATCPLVSKVHKTGQRFAQRDFDIILIGHPGHAEVHGTLGRINGRVSLVTSVDEVAHIEVKDPDKVAYITQTTLSLRDTQAIITALQARFPAIQGPHTDDICYATQNRQNAVAELAPHVDLLLVVGAANSSNSTRLQELGDRLGTPSYLLSDASALMPHWLEGVRRLGITAGASAPDELVQELVAELRRHRRLRIREIPGAEETVKFVMPAMPESSASVS